MGRIGRSAIAVVMLGAVAATPAAAAPPPAAAAVADRVVFSTIVGSDADGTASDFFTERVDGTDAVRSTADGQHKSAAVPSPDGTRLAYAIGPKFGDSTIAVAAVDGGPAQRVAVGATELRAPTWSPLGDRLAYAAGAKVMVVPERGGTPTVAFTAPQGTINGVRWSPASETILAVTVAFEGGGDDPPTYRLWRGAASGAGWSEVTRPGSPVSSQLPAWSPTGDELVTTASGAAAGHFVVFEADGSFARELAVTGASPVWSPDGTRILYSSASGLRVVGRDGTGDRGIPTPAGVSASAPVWSPDGARIAFVGAPQEQPATGPAAFDVYVMGADGSAPRRLENPTATRWATDPQFIPTAFGSTARAAGADRVATSVEVSRRAFPAAATAVLARSDIYADALAAAPLTSAAAPVLLTTSTALPASVKAELRRLGVTRVLLMGTADAIAPSVESELRGMGLAVERVGGADRFATAAAAAARLPGSHGWLVKGFDRDPARGWEDAVAVSAVAAATGEPILLTMTDELPAATAKALGALDSVTIVGGTAAVSDAVARAAASQVTVDRVAGADRYATAVAVAGAPQASRLDGATAWMASGTSWPDAVSAGPAAASGRAPLLLVDRDALATSSATRTWLTSTARVRSAVLVGGTAAIGLDVARQVRALLDPR